MASGRVLSGFRAPRVEGSSVLGALVLRNLPKGPQRFDLKI